jgi:TonB-dependent SusC/RagA subfamily outer membrane receptor
MNGKYSIHVARGETLVFSYVGYGRQEVPANRTIVDVSLEEDVQTLSDVVIVGYGTMKRSDLTGSVVSITGDDIRKSVSTSLDQALQGRAAGVSVTQNSGAPGGGISVSIRGTNTFSGNEPLYVIDGIAIDGNTGSNTRVLSFINPADIVSMEILKGASASAIYGTRAANGVMMITTKRGQTGKASCFQLSEFPSTETFVSATQNALKKSELAVQDNSIALTLPKLSVTAIRILLQPNSGIRQPEETQIQLYPNPAKRQVMLETPGLSGKTIITICDMTGKTLQTLQPENKGKTTIPVDISDFEKGLYIVNVRDNHTNYSQKLFVE